MAVPTKEVLVVDDDSQLRALLVRYMTRQGYAVSEADTADGAWHMLQQGKRPDFIITDVDMPGTLNGIQMLEKLRQKEQAEGAAHIPVMVQSGIMSDIGADGASVSRELHIKNLPGENSFIAKPFTLKEVAAIVNAKLGSPEREGGRAP